MQALGGFETSQLAPGEEEVLSITIPWKELAVYEEERAAWVLEKGGVCTGCGKLFQKYGLWKIYANRTGLCSGAM